MGGESFRLTARGSWRGSSLGRGVEIKLPLWKMSEREKVPSSRQGIASNDGGE